MSARYIVGDVRDVLAVMAGLLLFALLTRDYLA